MQKSQKQKEREITSGPLRERKEREIISGPLRERKEREITSGTLRERKEREITSGPLTERKETRMATLLRSKMIFGGIPQISRIHGHPEVHGFLGSWRLVG